MASVIFFIKTGKWDLKYAVRYIGISSAEMGIQPKKKMANGQKVRYYPKHTIPSSKKSTINWGRGIRALKIGATSLGPCHLGDGNWGVCHFLDTVKPSQSSTQGTFQWENGHDGKMEGEPLFGKNIDFNKRKKKVK